MIVLMPDVNPKGLYTQKQAAEALHVSRHSIARYTRGGRIHFFTRGTGKQRVTTGEEIIRCWRVQFDISI